MAVVDFAGAPGGRVSLFPSESLAKRMSRPTILIRSPGSRTACWTGCELTRVPLRLPQSSMCHWPTWYQTRACSRLAWSSSSWSWQDGCRPIVTAGVAESKRTVVPEAGPLSTTSENMIEL
ncbi:MAG: hypothetical protein A2V70_14695 [Planctomycetes bacterium RBG_13_63_9]|nr:MAG: hypothetical protein A2V70_14695 [Planctomycetes bacterium RBG_13_63_9]